MKAGFAPQQNMEVLILCEDMPDTPLSSAGRASALARLALQLTAWTHQDWAANATVQKAILYWQMQKLI